MSALTHQLSRVRYSSVQYRRLMHCCTLVVLISVGLVITRCVTEDNNQAVEERTTLSRSKSHSCWTPGCLKTATDLLSSLDPTVDPCRDFYQYACGKWIKKNDPSKLVTPRLIWDRFSEVEDENDKFLHDVIKSGGERHKYAKVQAVNKAFQYFKSCLDTQTKNRRGSEPLAHLLTKYQLDCLITKSCDVDNLDVTDTVVKLTKDLKVYPFVSVSVETDLRNGSQYVITLQRSIGFGIPTRVLLYNTTENLRKKEIYKDKMRNMSVLLGAEVTPELERDLEEIIKIKTRYAKEIKLYYEFNKDKLYKKTTLGELEDITRTSKIDWVRYIRNVFADANVNMTRDYKIVVYDIEYMRNISLFTSSLSKRSLVNYLTWLVIDKSSFYLGQEFEDVIRQYHTQSDGIYNTQSIDKQCFFELRLQFGMALGRVFVDERFSGDSKILVKEIAKNFRSTLIRSMRNLTWMEVQSKLAAIEKAKNIIQRIGFPDFILDDTKLDQYYEDIKIDESTYFENIFSVLASLVKRNAMKLGTTFDKKEWTFAPVQVNALYNPVANKIVFPAGILQPPFYNKDYLRAASYGAIGTVIGHEIIHGFDNEGSKYDKHGNLVPWWTKKTRKAFEKRIKCLVDQYNNLTFYGYQVNGLISLPENIADNAGVKYALQAYTDWTRQNGEEIPLHGTMFTNTQVFFISFAQIWCKSFTRSGRVFELYGNYAPAPYRVNATLQNIPEFAEAFDCPLGSPMNPEHKCRIW